jgi:hypothetical protein
MCWNRGATAAFIEIQANGHLTAWLEREKKGEYKLMFHRKFGLQFVYLMRRINTIHATLSLYAMYMILSSTEP